jgi:hypothetical protein
VRTGRDVHRHRRVDRRDRGGAVAELDAPGVEQRAQFLLERAAQLTHVSHDRQRRRDRLE